MVTVCEYFGLKTTRTISSGLASKPAATVSPGLASKPVISFLVEPQNQGGGEFSGMSLKIGSFSLMIWTLKSPQRFIGLSLKIKWASVYRLHNKTGERRLMWDMLRDLTACFVWKQVWLGFLSLA
jgi:hypothetical protein